MKTDSLSALKELPGFYAVKDKRFEKDFIKKLNKVIPHSDHIPSGIFHTPPSPNLVFNFDQKTLDYSDLDRKIAKMFWRLRAISEWVGLYRYSSPLYLCNLGEMSEKTLQSWGEFAPASDTFENHYYLSEDFSYGVIIVVHGSKIILFGKTLIELIKQNRDLSSLASRGNASNPS